MSFEAVVKVFDGVFVRHIFTFEAMKDCFWARSDTRTKQCDAVRNNGLEIGRVGLQNIECVAVPINGDEAYAEDPNVTTCKTVVAC